MTTTPHPSPLIPTTARAGLTFGLILVVMYVARLLSFQIPLLHRSLSRSSCLSGLLLPYPALPPESGLWLCRPTARLRGDLGIHPAVLLLPLRDAPALGGLGGSPAHGCRTQCPSTGDDPAATGDHALAMALDGLLLDHHLRRYLGAHHGAYPASQITIYYGHLGSNTPI